MPLRPGMPANTGGNDPIRAAAQSNMQEGMRDPSQLPQGPNPQAGLGGPPDPQQMGGQPMQQGPSVGQHLAAAWQLYVQGQANPEDTENIRQFFEAFVELANTMSQDQAPPPGAQPGPPPGMNPQQSAQAAPVMGRPY